MRNKFRLLGAGIIIVAVLLAMGFEYSRKEAEREKLNLLYSEASDSYPNIVDTDRSLVAVHQIGENKSEQAGKMLLDLSTSHSDVVLPIVRVAAITELASRADGNTGIVLAGLITPEQLFESRKAAADGLLRVKCQEKCIALVVEYLHQIYVGKKNYEDQLSSSFIPKLPEEVQSKLNEDQNAIYDQLYEVLRREINGTNNILSERYGLGSPLPSGFALNLVVRLKDHESCTALLASKSFLNRAPDSSARVNANQLNLAIKAAGC